MRVSFGTLYYSPILLFPLICTLLYLFFSFVFCRLLKRKYEIRSCGSWSLTWGADPPSQQTLSATTNGISTSLSPCMVYRRPSSVTTRFNFWMEQKGRMTFSFYDLNDFWFVHIKHLYIHPLPLLLFIFALFLVILMNHDIFSDIFLTENWTRYTRKWSTIGLRAICRRSIYRA